MNSKLTHVLAPKRVAGHLLKNRIISGPSTIHTAASGLPYPTEEGIRFFEDRAKAGVGLVTCAGVSIGGFNDDGVHASWDLTVPNHQNQVANLAERIHLYGAKCTMELIGVFPEGYTVSDGCSIMGSPPIGREIPVEKMEEFKQGYVEAAKALKALGYDGIMFHFGHSIPVAQFLSPYTNRRTDKYGGSTENRCRYLVEILEAVRAAVGRDMIFDVRISGCEFQEGGIDVEEGIRIGQQLQPYADILQVSAGMHNSDWMTWTHPCSFLPPMPNIYLAEAFKKSGKITTNVSAIGAVGSLYDADDIISSGKADFVVMARALIADMDIIAKDKAGRHEDVTPCIKCMRCHDSDNYAQHMQCSVNPRVGLVAPVEKALARKAAPKKVAVIGGGPAGMRCALTAAERGHSVTLFEKTDKLGGKLVFADYVSFKYSLKNYKDFLVAQIAKSPVTVKLGTEPKPEELSGFDAVIAAVGAEPLILPIKGVELCIPAIDTYGKESQLGDSVVIIGGGQVGCETGLHLAKLGKKVVVLEMRDDLAPDASKTHRDELMIELSKEPNFSCVTGGKCAEVTAEGVSYEKDGKLELLPAKTVILAAGMKAKTADADAYMGLTDDFAQIGDCVRARTVEWATKEGFYAAVSL